jgi:hypothetical protein
MAKTNSATVRTWMATGAHPCISEMCGFTKPG